MKSQQFLSIDELKLNTMKSLQPFSYQSEDEIAVPETYERFPQFLEGRYNMKSKFEPFNNKNRGTTFNNFSSEKGKWILARGKTSTLRLSSEARNGTFAIGVVHGSPDYFTEKITQLQHKTPKGIHPKKKDFTRGKDFKS